MTGTKQFTNQSKLWKNHHQTVGAGFTSSNREKRIDDALRYYGLSVIIRTENEFNHIKKFLSDDVLYIDFVPQMSSKLTAIVIWSDMKEFTTGSVGCAESQKEHFIRVVEFNDFFKI